VVSREEKLKKVLVNIARFVLATVLILSGFVKAVDPLGTQYKIADYLTAMHLGHVLPDFMTLGASVLLSALEFVLGICLMFAIRRRLVSRLVLVVMLVMTPLTLWLAVANPVSDCGCFGDAVVLTNWQTFWKNVVLLAMAALVARWPLDMMRFVSRSNQWIVINYTVIFILAVSGWSLYDLPYFDFRPYHVGTNLREGWQKMMDGEDSPYVDFFVERIAEGDDITEPMLLNEGYTLLMVAPHLEQADDSQLDRINQLYDYAVEYGYPFYCLTASGEAGINEWRETTGAEYPYCQTDETTLKTIIRSNPGVVLLKDGKIVRKWSHNRLPDETELSGRLEHTALGQMPADSIPGKVLVIILWYVLPLVVLVVADRLWMWTRWVKKKKKVSNNDINQQLKKVTQQ
jgi:triosephosphate isomerase